MARIATTNFGTLGLIPFRAESPVKEVLTFKTSINPSFDGSEERFRLRGKPNTTLIYDYTLDIRQHPDVWNTLYHGIRDSFAIPLFHEGQNIGPVDISATELTLNTTDFDLLENGLALLTGFSSVCGQGNANYQLVELGSLTGGGIELASSLNQSFGDCYVFPVKVGKIGNQGDWKTTGYQTGLHLVYEIETEHLWYEDDWTAPFSLANRYLLEQKSLQTGNRQILARNDKTNFEVGTWEHRGPWISSKYIMPYKRRFSSLADTKEFKKFLCYHGGMFGEFWYPTHEVNLRIKTQGAITDTFNIYRDSFDSWNVRPNLVFQDSEKNWHFKVINSVGDIDADTIQIELTDNLDLNTNEIIKVCFVGVNRLNEDSIEFNYLSNQVTEVETSFAELKPQADYYYNE